MPSTDRPSRHGLDPLGKRALFETPVSAADDTIRPGRTHTGKAALFSTGPREPGTAIVECSTCTSRTRLGVGNVAVRLAAFSLFQPLFRPQFPHRIKCPACHQSTWCRIGWNE